MKTRPPLGQLLIEKKIITPEQLHKALDEQKKTKELLGMTLVRQGVVDEEKIYLPVLADQLGVEFVLLKDVTVDPKALGTLPAKMAEHYQVFPVEIKNSVLAVATSKPLDVSVLDEIALVTKTKVRSVLASAKDIREAIRKYYGLGAQTIEQMMGEVSTREVLPETAEDLEQLDSDASIAKFINQLLLEAYRDRATDIHIEPFEDELKVRYRIDGLLYDAKVPANIKHFKDSINSRIKILSNLNIAEKRLPQDGRFNVRIGATDLDLRVSFLPTPYGESVVLRLLSSAKLLSLSELGLLPDQEKLLGQLIEKPHGIIFLTGPTGSGKTTTLYSCLSRVNRIDNKIITIEDPVEYQIKGITQIQVNPAVGLTFAAGLRSMLRHDPDVMMVGEVRDVETAEITIQVALTGHLVFSTLHTNDAASGVARLTDMGVETFLISSSVLGFIAQRLVRLICPKCKHAIEIKPERLKELGFDPQGLASLKFFEGQGCEACKFTGYQGREGIYEFLVMNDAIRDLVARKASSAQIREAAIKHGMQPLRVHGLLKAQKGLTTLSEVVRVTQEDEI